MFKPDLMRQYDGQLVCVSVDRTKDPSTPEGHVYVGRVKAYDTNFVTLQPYRCVRDDTDVLAARIEVTRITSRKDRRREKPLTLGRGVIASIESFVERE